MQFNYQVLPMKLFNKNDLLQYIEGQKCWGVQPLVEDVRVSIVSRHTYSLPDDAVFKLPKHSVVHFHFAYKGFICKWVLELLDEMGHS
jgi:hypothetical protein